MEYQALYRKYRPQTFEDVIGQSHVTSTLAREVAEGHVAHAYLFAGPRGTGKTTTARILAKALNCADRHPDGSPCNACSSCVAITEGNSLDVLELDAASHNSVDDIRDMRVSVSTVASSDSARRVFILDEAHMLSRAAGNALLKTLEEPPEHVYFVLATTEPYKLADTIRSRAQRFDFHAVPVETIAAHLSRIAEAEGMQTDTNALVAVARHALGSVRDSLSLLEQVAALGDGKVDPGGVSRALALADDEAFAALVDALENQDASAALELVARLASQGVDLRRFVGQAAGFFRGAFLAHYAPNLAEVADEPDSVLESWRSAAARLPAADVLRAVDLLGEALIKLREGREERLMLELAMIKLARPETATDPGAVLSRIERIERRLSSVTTLSPGGGVETPAKPASAPAPATDSEVAAPDDQTSGEVEASPTVAAEVPEPVVEPSSEPPPEEPSVTFEQFQTIWPGLFGGLRDLLGSRRWALFRETEPGAVEGSTLVVHVRHDFHLTALRSDPAVAAIVATRAGDLLGRSVEVEFRPADGMSSAAASEPEIDDEPVDKDRMAEAGSDPTDPFKLIEEELGGKVVDEYETDEE